MSRRQPFWELFAGAGLFGAVLAVVALHLLAAVLGGIVVLACLWHWSH